MRNEDNAMFYDDPNPFLDCTYHCHYRTNTRGITYKQMLLTLKYGKLIQDRYILRPRDVYVLLDDMKKDAMKATRQRAQQQGKKARVPHYSPEVESEMRVLKQIADKGGLVVVETGNLCITAFHFSSKHWADFSPNYARSHKRAYQ